MPNTQIAIAGSVLVGLVFLLTGIAKIIAPWKFIVHLSQLKLLPNRWIPQAAFTFTAIETTLGIALIFAVAPKITIEASILLILGLSVLTYWSTSTGRTEDCGCYNGAIDVSPVQSLLLNGVYVLFLAIALILTPQSSTQLWQWAIVWVTLTASYGLANGSLAYVRANGHPFIDFSPLQADRPWQPSWLGEEINSAINLDSGIVVFLSPQCPSCKKWLNVLKVVHVREDLPDVLGVISLSPTMTPEQGQAFVDSYDLNFPVGGVKETLYNKLDIMGVPTAVLLEGGIVREIWTGTMPESFIDRIRAGDLSYPVSEELSAESEVGAIV